MSDQVYDTEKMMKLAMGMDPSEEFEYLNLKDDVESDSGLVFLGPNPNWTSENQSDQESGSSESESEKSDSESGSSDSESEKSDSESEKSDSESGSSDSPRSIIVLGDDPNLIEIIDDDSDN